MDFFILVKKDELPRASARGSKATKNRALAQNFL